MRFSRPLGRLHEVVNEWGGMADACVGRHTGGVPALPDGEPAPQDGRLPDGLDWSRPLRAYVHVPFCAVRCGYCDFNTYTPGELGGFDTDGYLDALQREVRLAQRVGHVRPLESLFIGGGTPSLLSGEQIDTIVDALRQSFGFTAGAEITMEANPENVTPASLQQWLQAGVTRISLGMQNADQSALALLQRVHTPGAAVAAARMAAQVGFAHVSLDLIYGVPGQDDQSWRQTLLTALEAQPDHISAYALGVEPGTALFRQVQRGQIPDVDSDRAAAQYDIADEVLAEHGFAWYEISNWARPGGQCRHNLGYWRHDNWWGFGPGAHSHIDGVRWWNVKRPAAYQQRLADGQSPAAAREVLDTPARKTEAVMLAVRLAEGFPAADRLSRLLFDRGLVESAGRESFRLTRRGRMLADTVTRILLGWDQPADTSGPPACDADGPEVM